MRHQDYVPSESSVLVTDSETTMLDCPSSWMIVSTIRSGLGSGKGLARTPMARRAGRARVKSFIVGFVGDIRVSVLFGLEVLAVVTIVLSRKAVEKS